MTVLHRISLSLAALTGAAGLFLSAVSAQAQTIAFNNFDLSGSYLFDTSIGINSSFSPAYEFTALEGGRLESITTSILWVSGTNAVTLGLYTSENGKPGMLLETISTSGLSYVFPSELKTLKPFVSSAKTELIAGNSYFLKASASGSASLDWCRNRIGDTGALYIVTTWTTPLLEQNVVRGAFSVMVSPVPEPSTYAALCGVAALGLVVWRRRAKR